MGAHTVYYMLLDNSLTLSKLHFWEMPQHCGTVVHKGQLRLESLWSGYDPLWHVLVLGVLGT